MPKANAINIIRNGRSALDRTNSAPFNRHRCLIRSLRRPFYRIHSRWNYPLVTGTGAGDAGRTGQGPGDHRRRGEAPDGCGKHIPSDLVVNRWTCDGESGSHRDILCRHDAWTMVRRQISWKITAALSMSWHFTTKSDGIWFPQICQLWVYPRWTSGVGFFSCQNRFVFRVT